jgi:putative ABC transport system permease protein
LYLQPGLYPERADRVRRWEELTERVEALPGITAAGVGENVPFGHDDGFRSVSDLNEIVSTGGTVPLSVDRRAISPNYFQLLRMPLLRGRVFTSADRVESPGVAIINEALARKLAPAGGVLGRKMQIQGAPLPAYEIVGVVANARSMGTSTEVWDEIYIPYAQSAATFGFLIVASELDSAALDAMLRKEIRSWAPALPYNSWTTATSMEDLINRSVVGPRFSATLISAFSGMALLLAAIGVFGLVAYSVSQRLRELGVRAALGARPRDLLAATLRPAMLLTSVGVLLGLLAALYLTRFVESQLYGIERLDLPTFLGAGAVMFVVAGLAAYLPARRAGFVNPMTILRHE